jgi:hypothetical protein
MPMFSVHRSILGNAETLMLSIEALDNHMVHVFLSYIFISELHQIDVFFSKLHQIATFWQHADQPRDIRISLDRLGMANQGQSDRRV